MAIEQRQMAFSYASLAPDVRARVETATRRLHDLERRTSESIIEMGKHLTEVKRDIPGQFERWIADEFGWSRRTAYNLIRVAESFGDVQNLHTIHPSALYVLASESTPDEVRVEFTELAALGQQVTHKAVKERIDQVKPRADNDLPRNTATVDRDTGEIVDDDYPDAEVVDWNDPASHVWEPPPQTKSSPPKPQSLPDYAAIAEREADRFQEKYPVLSDAITILEHMLDILEERFEP